MKKPDRPRMIRPKVFFIVRLAAVLSLTAVVLLSGCARTPATDPLSPEERAWLTEHDGKIRLTHDPDAKPIEFTDEKGRFRGMTADYVRLIEQVLGFKFKIINSKTWTEAIEKAERGDVEVIPAFTKNKERQQWFLFTEPYITIPTVILTRKDTQGSLSLEKMAHMKITFTKGWVIEDFLRKNYPDYNYLPAENENAAMNMVSTGQADAWVSALTTASAQIYEGKVTNLRVAGTTEFSFKLAMASRKDWPILNRILVKGLFLITPDERTAIFDKWIHLGKEPMFGRKFWIGLYIGAGTVLAIILFFVFWTISLRRQVEARTRQLRTELDRKLLTEKALRESETRLQLALESAVAGTWEWIIKTNEALWSADLHKLFDLPEDTEHCFENWWRSIAPEDRPHIKVVMEEALKKGGEINIEWRVHTTDGSLRWVMSRGKPQWDSRGELNRYLGVVIDITQRKLAEEALKESKLFLENLSDIAYTTDTRGIVTWINRAAEPISGFKVEDIIGQPYLPFFIEEDRASSEDIYARTLAGESLEKTLTLTSGVTCHFTSLPRRNEKGEIVGTFGVARDITELLATQKALMISEKRLKKAQATARIGNWEWDLETDRVWGSEEAFKIFGLERKSEYLALEDTRARIVEIEEVLRAQRNLLEKGGDYNIEYHLKGEDGRPAATIHSIAELIIDDEGRPKMMVGVIHDITELRAKEQERNKLREQLQQTQKMEAVGTLTGGIAHDFNNILSAMIGFSELALDDSREGKTNPDAIRQVIEAGNRARELVTQILTFSRKVEPELKLVEFNDIVIQTDRLLERTIPKMVSIEKNLAEDLWPVRADANQLSRVLINLAANANDAMPEGGRLAIETVNVTLEEEYTDLHLGAEAGDYVKLTVSDTGSGMDDETLKHMFEPFFTLKEVGQGTGMGLATVYGIIHSHKGFITCYSEVDRGTTFNIFLPAVRDGECAPPVDRPNAGQVAGGHETILLVDDEQALRSLGRHILTQEGYRVLTAGTGEEALEVFRSGDEAVDLVILDISMPGMGGHKCLEKLVEIDPKVRVIIASGYSLTGRLKDVMSAGAAGYVAKPFTKAELLEAIRLVLDS